MTNCNLLLRNHIQVPAPPRTPFRSTLEWSGVHCTAIAHNGGTLSSVETTDTGKTYPIVAFSASPMTLTLTTSTLSLSAIPEPPHPPPPPPPQPPEPTVPSTTFPKALPPVRTQL
ncbi:hypothetical protein ACLKA7_009973 [Drosophila subpalustris]